MTITTIDVKECTTDRSVVVHIRLFKLLKTLYGSCFMLAKKPVPINSGRRKYQHHCTSSTDRQHARTAAVQPTPQPGTPAKRSRAGERPLAVSRPVLGCGWCCFVLPLLLNNKDDLLARRWLDCSCFPLHVAFVVPALLLA